MYHENKILLTSTLTAGAQMYFGTKKEVPDSVFNALAQTPPMGWNSWNKFGCNVSEQLIKEMADAMIATGMKDAGYEYLVIDDCWQVGRDEEGNIQVDPKRFPNGMKALADYVHAKGLKMGIYSCAGSETCQGRPGSRGYQFQDARTYAAWGIDYLKYDWCSNEGQKAEAAYRTMSDALKACGRPIVFSICEWGENEPWKWGKGIGHLWRITPDIRDCYQCVFDWGGVGVLDIIDKMADLYPYAGPGHWNDAEMLEVGNGGMTRDEYITHFSMWCMGEKEIWAKPLNDGELAVCFMNRTENSWKLDYDWKKQTIYFADEVNIHRKEYKIRDLWQHKDIGTTERNTRHEIPAHGVLMVRLTPTK